MLKLYGFVRRTMDEALPAALDAADFAIAVEQGTTTRRELLTRRKRPAVQELLKAKKARLLETANLRLTKQNEMLQDLCNRSKNMRESCLAGTSFFASIIGANTPPPPCP